MNKHKPLKTLASPPDPEVALFARLVERILNWPCPKCGKRGLCNCFSGDGQMVGEIEVGLLEADCEGDSQTAKATMNEPRNPYHTRPQSE